LSGERIEAAVGQALYDLASQSRGEALRQHLPFDRAGWEKLEVLEQRRIIGVVVEQVAYDRRIERRRVRLRPEVPGENGIEATIQAGKKPLVGQTSPGAVQVTTERIPRITKLMALAIRLEELLRQGIASNNTELARLAGISRARITQILNLRNLAPVLQERILDARLHRGVTEGALRRISAILDWEQQVTRFDRLFAGRGAEASGGR
jgi:hypothetical protein